MIGWFMRQKLEKSTKNIKLVQEQYLMSLINQNGRTEYGKQYKLYEIKSKTEFINVHPLTRIKHYEEYIGRMMKGETNVLTSKPPAMFAVTSGTSGKSSIVPTSNRHRFVFFKYAISIVVYSMMKAFPANKQLQKILKFFYTPRWRKSESGLLIGPSSSTPTNTRAILNLYSTPKEGLNILDEPVALYIHLLFGLRERDIGTIEANFSSTIYTAFKALEYHKETLVHDIMFGCLNSKLEIDKETRNDLESLLIPDPERAKEIKGAFSKGSEGLAKRLWPNCHLVLCCDTGSFALQADMLRESFCKGIHIYSPIYSASEGLIGLNIWPNEKPSRYLLLPETLFYEFIPIENTVMEQPKPLFLEEVKANHVYELVITTGAGLYRYRFGDVVKVVSFYNQCPVIEFLYRGEKTSEAALYQALVEGSKNWQGLKLTDYCCAENSYVPYYLVFIELDKADGTLSKEEKNMVYLFAVLYFQYLPDVCTEDSSKGSILPMKLQTVRFGTFQELRQFTIETTSASSNQYKCPRVLKRREALHFIMQRLK
ncbi:hypothetical protein KUTeg_023912 [Tegillarca granosa]|uniref:GH3 domain-containing protein n=1 Tax=Tegillarca granosa TaxID=220873 RepID=A0ABQ9DVQ3_TEGGR|nr:hypothetical protein KUTeg_023912 [Tegillarca granosa]